MSDLKWVKDDFIDTEQRDLGQIRRVLIITMLLNFAATGIKLAAGLATGALSVVADGLDSLFDGLSNVVGLAGLYAASRPPDASHPYGHRKFETLAALSVAFLLFLTCWQLLVSAWERFNSLKAPQVNLWTGAAMVIAMLIALITSLYELRQGRLQNSEILIADAMHTRASILVSASVLGGLALIKAGFPRADPILAALVALVIAKIGVDILRETLPVLVDRVAVDPERIAEVVEEVGGIESFHRVRSRGALGSAAVDLHVRVSPEKTIQEANAIADEVRRRLLTLGGVTDVTVHVEAQRLPAPDAADLFAVIKQAANELDLMVHEMWAHRLGEDLYVEMHIGVDPDMTMREAHARVDRLEMAIRERLPQIHSVHTHIEPASKQVQPGDRPPSQVEGHIHQEVIRALERVPGLSNPHNIQVRRNPAAEDKLFISLECSVDPDTPVSHAHHLASLLEQELSQRLEDVADISVHLEPPGSD
jgi:cation diffusion facilitator family transporter